MYAGDIQSAHGRRHDLTAGLFGASLVLDASRETRFDIEKAQQPLVSRFLSLVEQRVTRLTELNNRGQQ
jgi:hypothetical protein